MSFDPRRLIFALALGLAASLPTVAQPVYKCGRSAEPTYSDRPCSNRVVNTTEAHAPANPTPAWVDQDRVLARSLRRLPGESAPHYAARQRRATLPDADREECERLDTRIPVEEERMKTPDPAEAAAGKAGLEAARHRFAHLHC